MLTYCPFLPSFHIDAAASAVNDRITQCICAASKLRSNPNRCRLGDWPITKSYFTACSTGGYEVNKKSAKECRNNAKCGTQCLQNYLYKVLIYIW